MKYAFACKLHIMFNIIKLVLSLAIRTRIEDIYLYLVRFTFLRRPHTLVAFLLSFTCTFYRLTATTIFNWKSTLFSYTHQSHNSWFIIMITEREGWFSTKKFMHWTCAWCLYKSCIAFSLWWLNLWLKKVIYIVYM